MKKNENNDEVTSKTVTTVDRRRDFLFFIYRYGTSTFCDIVVLYNLIPIHQI